VHPRGHRAVRPFDRDPQRRERGDDQSGDRRLADPPECQRREGDPELGRGEVLVELAVDLVGARRVLVALLREGLERARPDLREREFGRDEEPVREDAGGGEQEVGSRARAPRITPVGLV